MKTLSRESKELVRTNPEQGTNVWVQEIDKKECWWAQAAFQRWIDQPNDGSVVALVIDYFGQARLIDVHRLRFTFKNPAEIVE